MKPERLQALAEQGLCPHVVIDNSELRFQPGKIEAWAKGHLWIFREGVKLDRPVFTVNTLKWADRPQVPLELADINNLMIMETPQPISGVYFLCLAGEVVYVGQSVSVYSRVPSHTDKQFDTAYFVPLAPDVREYAEKALIVLLKPRYNKGQVLLSAEQAMTDLVECNVVDKPTSYSVQAPPP